MYQTDDIISYLLHNFLKMQDNNVITELVAFFQFNIWDGMGLSNKKISLFAVKTRESMVMEIAAFSLTSYFYTLFARDSGFFRQAIAFILLFTGPYPFSSIQTTLNKLFQIVSKKN